MNVDIKLHKLDLPDDLAFSDKIAIDCEFMGLNVERDRLCLVQISNGNNDAHIVQLDKENYKAPNLKKLLTNKSINKIFHFARADLLFIKKYLEINVENINCSKIASKLARTFSDKHGLKDLIKEFVGVDVSKQLGHHSVKLTLDVYGHWVPGQNKSQVDALDSLHLSAPYTHPGADYNEKTDPKARLSN